MIAVENVLRKLISEYEFVIIPGFGALLSHHIPAAYDRNSGFFSPPAKKLAFNEYLKLDDGLLANYISRHEPCTHTEAVDHVKAYCDKLKLDLEDNGQAIITGVGEFAKNIEGKLVFEPRTEKYFKDDWYGFEKVKVKHFNKQIAAKQANHTYVAEQEVEVIEFEDEKVRTFNWRRWTAAAVVTGVLCGLSLFFVNSKNTDIQSTLNPFQDLFSKAGHSETVSEEPAKAAYSDETTVVVEPGSTKVDTFTATTFGADSTAGSASVPVAAVPVKVKATSKFYVIAGAFKGPKQAKVLLADLQAKGFDDALIIPGNKYSTKVKVAIDGYATETDAYRASRRLKDVIGQEGWVFKLKSNK